MSDDEEAPSEETRDVPPDELGDSVGVVGAVVRVDVGIDGVAGRDEGEVAQHVINAGPGVLDEAVRGHGVAQSRQREGQSRLAGLDAGDSGRSRLLLRRVGLRGAHVHRGMDGERGH
jgi:hypothetical protein